MADLSSDSVASVNEAFEAITTLQSRSEAMVAIVDRLPVGVFLVGNGCKVHETNDRARKILSLNDGIQIHRGVLKAASRSETRHLHEVVAVALDPQKWHKYTGEDVIVLSRPSGQLEFSALVSPLIADQDVFDKAFAVIFLSENSRPLQIDPRRLKTIFAFTPAEARVASLLAQGLKVEDIAEYLGNSLNTVRTHLKGIFDKTGCDRQAEVVRIILSGVPIILRSEKSQNGDHLRNSRL